jgi:hypothetical protein
MPMSPALEAYRSLVSEGYITPETSQLDFSHTPFVGVRQHVPSILQYNTEVVSLSVETLSHAQLEQRSQRDR